MSDRPASSQPKAPALPPNTPADISVFEDRGGYVLRDQDGMALYQYDLDVDGRPHCVDACALTWPPVLASEGASSVVGEWKTIKRGTARQWTYRGKPVYTYSKDAPGETKGDGVDGKWHLISL
jgi:predicted lipoprotein with Yx(FWY)xxD motif